MKKKLLFFILLFFVGSQLLAQSLFTSNLPILKIDTKGAAIIDASKITAILEVIDNASGLNTITDNPTLKTYIGIEYRGSTSQDFFPKKPYGFETRDSLGANNNISLLGLPAENDWVLNTSYDEKTFLRDVLSYDLARRMGRYASRSRYCEVMLNNSYIGMFILLEKIKVDKNRVNITKIKTTDITGDDLTGGYIIKIDKTTGAPDKSWRSDIQGSSTNQNRTLFQVDVPKITDIAPEQFTYIKAKVNGMEAALNKGDYLNPKAAYRDLIDIDSFVDYFLLTELNKNVDGYRLSTYFYKNKDSKGGKFVMGPAWDYNLAFGNANYYDGWKTTGWVYDLLDSPLTVQDYFVQPFWFKKLLKDTSFVSKIGTRWKSLRKNVFSGNRINNYIDSTAKVISEGEIRDNQRWKTIGTNLWPNYYVGPTYQAELNWLKDWIQQRLAYMDAYLNTYGILLANEPEKVLKMLNSYPNPSANDFTINYQVLERGQVKLQVIDPLGRAIAELVNQNQAAGQYQISWKPNQSGSYIIDYQKDNVPVERLRVVKF